MIDAQHLAMCFGPLTALRDATFHVEPGEILGLLGPNGAGKSTLMKILTTYLRPTSGTALVCGFDTQRDPLTVRQKIGYLPENLPLYPRMEVGEYLNFVGQARGLTGDDLKKRLAWILDRTGLLPMLHRPIDHLSKGYRQRTALAQALIHDPEVIILDEPTTGLDPHQILEIRALIQELAHTKTVLFSTHILQEVEAIAHRVIIISQGTIKAQGTLDELAAQAGVRPFAVAEIKASFAELHLVLNAEGLQECTLLRESGGWSCVRFASEGPTTLEQVAALCARNAFGLRNLSVSGSALEDIFLALTQAEQAA